MRRSQRLVLVVGALAILAVVNTCPRVIIVGGTLLRDLQADARMAAVIDVRTVGAYLVSIIVATTLFWLALNSGGKREDALEHRLDAFEQDFSNRWAELSEEVRALESHLTEPEKGEGR